jgi:hypothetical protein
MPLPGPSLLWNAAVPMPYDVDDSRGQTLEVSTATKTYIFSILVHTILFGTPASV